MKRLLLLLVIIASACSTASQSQPIDAPSRGSLRVEVVPNPILARALPAGVFEFPFEVVIRETAGVDVTVTEVAMDVVAFGALTVHSERYGPEEIRRRGFPTNVPAGSELRYRFQPRGKIEDSRLFGGVSAEVTIRGISGQTEIEPARTSVTVSSGE